MMHSVTFLFTEIVVFIVVFTYCYATDEIIDLTWNFNNETVYWPGQRHFEFTKQVKSKSRGYWYSVKEFCTAEHGGTHFDAPYHFNENGWKVSEVPIYRLFANGALVDLRDKVEQSVRDARLTVKDLEDWEARHGSFENGTVLLIKTGLSKFWGANRKKYLELDSENNINFPGVSAEAAEWIVKTEKFYGVGLDTPSIDPGNSTDFIVHRIFAKNQLYNLENVKLVENLPEKGFSLIIAPMKIEDGTGAPVRIFAVV